MSAPVLVNWGGMLSNDGKRLADWLDATGTPIPEVPALAGSLISKAARYFTACPDEAVAAWQMYISSMSEGVQQR